MEVKFADTFWPSFKKMMNSENPRKFEYYKHKWYDFKRALWALRKYFRVTTKMVAWDSGSVIEMMKFQIGILADHIETRGLEVDENRLPKVEKMRKFIKLAEHYREDDYADRCGYEDGNLEMVSTESGIEMVQADPDVDRHNARVFKEAHKLQEKEWDEMIELLKDMRSWWD